MLLILRAVNQGTDHGERIQAKQMDQVSRGHVRGVFEVRGSMYAREMPQVYVHASHIFSPRCSVGVSVFGIW